MASSDSVLSDDELQPLYVYYVGWFFFLLLVLFLFKYVSGSSVLSSHDSSKQPAVVTSEFKRFQRNFLLVYLLMMAADWLQGPYVYALYKHYGFDKGQIGVLFIVGFGASMIFGAFVGSMADKYGRKKMCLAFGVMYSASCITKHFGDYNTLLTGRLLGGISTSILFSSFESWMVHEHHEHAYPEEWMGLTFSLATSGNGMVAIGAGVLASIVRERFGPVAPFDASLAFLIIGSLIIAFTWPENTGDSSVDLHRTIYNAFIRMKSDSKVWLLGVIQSFFEGAMYIFVFMWTPALESTSPFPIYHGWIFASFMICTLIGSGIFSFYLERGAKVERMALYMFAIAALSLLIPAFSSSHTVRLCAFFIFEVCVGLFWPSLGFLRSRYVPEEVRATVMNFFRIPLNFIVVLVLSHINDLPDLKVFSLCFAFLMIAFLCQIQLCKLVFQSTTQSGKRITTAATDEEMSEMEMASAPLTSSSH